jgi:hypothetical protein
MNSKRFASGLAVSVVAYAVALGVASAQEGPGTGAGPVVAALGEARAGVFGKGTPDVEQAFWRCDYIGTTKGMQYTPVDLCMAVTEEIKLRKFGGDYDGMLAWWQQNKPAVHREMARLEARAH